MISLNKEEYDLHLMNYINKSTELQIIRHILTTKINVLQLKKEILKEKYKDLDNINYKVWITEDEFCNEIWNFSLRHNFNSFFNPKVNITKVNERHECKYNTVTDKNSTKIDICDEILKLKDEINIINNEIMLICNKNTETELRHCKSTLDNLKSFSEEIAELLKLITTSENLLNTRNTMTNRKLNTNVIEGFTSAKKLFKKFNFRDNILIENKLPSSSKIIEKPKEHYNTKHIKFGRFIMKKQSLISLKFEKKCKEFGIRELN
ncbi:uncharacterized protein LOC122539138 [Frieseomelitta varia]|uniref:uncharacterized protein LOC122539138 n=1 Tax=Frieseomelitta varia TaxID=561572 RepID=UPI001CB67E19|nr:uncharacterized protein LOC122539138 [Frieseomelitta varia]